MIQFNASNMRIWSRLGAAGTFGIAISELSEMDDRLMVLTADLRSFSGLDRFAVKSPEKFCNIGIAEQNMLGVAAGLASEGYNVFATTYATFASLRAGDQIKVNMGYMKQGIKLIGLAAGFSTGILGATHMAIEDISVIRSIPNITILSPADCCELVKCVLKSSEMKTPVYIRLTGGMNCPMVYKMDYDFEIGKAVSLRDGNDVLIIATGTMVKQALMAAEVLHDKNIECAVLNMHTIKPLDTQSIKEMIKNKKLVVTVEEHSVYGGLGSAVAEYMASMGCSCPLKIIGVNDYYPDAADYNYLLEVSGLSHTNIVNQIRGMLEEN